MKNHLGRRGIRLLLITTGLLAVAAGIAYAQIPDSSGVIHACYQSNTGSLHVIGSNPTVGANKCASNEKPLNWNQTGPTGAKGATGANGINGTNGAKGATGANGINGANGAKGATGANGINGAKGATGTAGTNGTNGATGPTGASGPTSTYWQHDSSSVSANTSSVIDEYCLPGDTLLSGGFGADGNFKILSDHQIHGTGFFAGRDGWQIWISNLDLFTNHSVDIYAICVDN